MKFSTRILAATFVVAFIGSNAHAQTEPPAAKPAVSLRTFYIRNASQGSDVQDIYNALRVQINDPMTFWSSSQSAILMQGSPEQLMLAQKIIEDLDRPKKTYRLTFTVAEMEGTKLIGTQHFAMVAVAGQMTTVKQGSKVPVPTGPPGTQFTQSTYMDMGMTFEATLQDSANGAILKSRVEDSGFQEDKSGDASGYPVVTRNTSLEGASSLTPGKPLMLGSLDIPGTTRRFDIQVLMEPLP
jgi:hypothetical protein